MGQPSYAFSGISCQLLGPLYGGVPVVVYTPTVTSPELLPISPTPDNMIDCARKTNCKVILTLPAVLVAWFKSPDTMEFLKSLNLIVSLMYCPLADRYPYSKLHLSCAAVVRFLDRWEMPS
jgi:hypothetical protein